MTLKEHVRALINAVGGDACSDALLDVLCADAESDFLSYCNRDDIPDAAQSIVAQLAVIRYNTLGAEGVSSQSFSGASTTYDINYPESVVHALNRFRCVRFI
ncbi:MAG: phage head-tail connector protein [Clostridiales bacterium]|nr:phage head-tail connector protein [Clostridiales bacterium]MDY4199265.1 phage head-tail connector protein [Candidatus Fimadaptatus sp.]